MTGAQLLRVLRSAARLDGVDIQLVRLDADAQATMYFGHPGPQIWIQWIESMVPGRGFESLRRLCQAADENDVVLRLDADDDGSGKLLDMYERLGFDRDHAGGSTRMERVPAPSRQRAFQQWFKGSLITVDGRPGSAPRVVFRGTPGGVSGLLPSARGSFGPGFYFAGDELQASQYATGDGKVRTYHLKLQNPYLHAISEPQIVDSWGEGLVMAIFEPEAADAVIAQAAVAPVSGFGAEITQRLQEMGHDGVVATYPDGTQELVAFWPGQVRSAQQRGDLDLPSVADAAPGPAPINRLDGPLSAEVDVVVSDMPEDMQDILMSFFGEFGLEVPAILKSSRLPISRFPDVPLADGVNDQRGVEYARSMIGSKVPPVVVYGDVWLDGRHRVWAAKQAGAQSVAAIDIKRYLPQEAMQVIAPIARLLKTSGAGSDIIHTEAFERWFGDSKVVDANGKPLVVYHGTGNTFDEFDTDARYGLGSHFGNYKQAAGFATEGSILPVYLNIRRPLRLTDPGDSLWMPEIVVAQLQRKKIVSGGDVDRVERMPDADARVEIVRLIRAAGYDGVVYKNRREGRGDSYIAFRPEQIKSATGNRGTFDRNNSDIRFSFAGQGAATANAYALTAAKQRVDAGDDAEAVRKEIGWFKGLDGKWRFEINDSGASLKMAWRYSSGTRFGDYEKDRLRNASSVSFNFTLGDILEHPALFAAYPGLRGIAVSSCAMAGAAFTGDRFEVSEDATLEGAVSAILHEIQHAIQTIEGFALGGSPENMPMERYLSLAGEVEARNTEARRGMNDEQRRTYPPSGTQDLADGDVLVVMTALEMAKASSQNNARKADKNDFPGYQPAPVSGGAMLSAAEEQDQTQTAAFRKWFGASKVVDAEGKPLPMYHGTTADFSTFDTSKGKPGVAEGAWFSSEQPSRYANGDGARVMPVYLAIKNPMVMDFANRGYDKAQLESEGYDGVIDIGRSGQPYTAVAFRPEQIKSAIGNRGTFDPDNADIRFSFAGKRSGLAPLDRLEDAKEMLSAGADSEQVRRETGWAFGADGQPRYEISDHLAFLKGVGTFGEIVMKRRAALGTEGPTYLPDILYHPELFDAYPALREIEVQFIPAGVKAHARVADSSIMEVRETLRGDDALSKVIHEVQHLIQTIEGFAPGGSAEAAFDAVPAQPGEQVGPGLSAAHQIFRELLVKSIRPIAIEVFAREVWKTDVVSEEVRVAYSQYVDVLKNRSISAEFSADVRLRAAGEWYRRLAGEIEARNAQARMRFTPQERLAIAPQATADRTESEAIFLPSTPRELEDAGGPLVPASVYHGTSQIFEAFEPNERGIFFAEDRTTAAAYVGVRRGPTSRVIEAEIDIRKPWTYVYYGQDVPYRDMMDQSCKALKEKGFDGIFMPRERVWVAFDPQQIRIRSVHAVDGVRRMGADAPKPMSAFDRWFGDSKVVKDGKPLVVFHGGQKLTAWNRAGDDSQVYGGHADAVKREFGSFLSPLERQHLDKPVHFFTDDESVAAGYGDQGSHYEVRSHFLKMERPLDLRVEVVGEAVVESHMRRLLGQDDFELPADRHSQYREISQALRWNWSDIREKAEALGHDGIILLDTDVRDRGRHTSYAVFEPTQIKSATANRGTFDPGNPDIRFSHLAQQGTGDPSSPFDFASDERFRHLFYGSPSAAQVKEFSSWLRARPNAFVRLYHGTAASHDIGRQGILPTSLSRRNSLQSSNGYVCLSVYPGLAYDFGAQAALNRAAAPDGARVAVYPVTRTVRSLLADLDQLRNRRLFGGEAVGNSLAESLVRARGARVRGRVDPSWIGVPIRYRGRGEMVPGPSEVVQPVSSRPSPDRTGNIELLDFSQRDVAPVGAWVKLDHPDLRGQPVAQVREVELEDLYLPELDGRGNLQPEKRSYLQPYLERALAGERPPNVDIVEMEDGRPRVVDGHRRVVAARLAGQKTIRATVSPLVEVPGVGRVPMTLEMLNRAPGGESSTDPFGSWFGDSKVVDESGRALPVYHGTIVRAMRDGFAMGDVAAFDRMFTTRFRKHSIDTVGSWFSTNPGEAGAQMYAGGPGAPGAVIYPVFLSIKNPHVTTFSLMCRRARLLANGEDDGRAVGRVEVDAYRKWLQEMGKDGIKIEGSGNDGSTEFDHQDAWIALEPEQIKSAIGNRGTYDRRERDIRYSFAGDRAATADLNALRAAQAWVEAGALEEGERVRTGWFKGVDGRWRFEIDDSQAKVLPAIRTLSGGGYPACRIESITYRRHEDGFFDVSLNPPNPQKISDFVELRRVSCAVVESVIPVEAVKRMEAHEGDEDFIGDFEPARRFPFDFEFGGMNVLPLDQVLDHPVLFEAYPGLRTVSVQVIPSMGLGASLCDMEDGSMVIRLGLAHQLSNLMHEIQHAIQNIEGFAQGGSPEVFHARQISAIPMDILNPALAIQEISARSGMSIGSIRARPPRFLRDAPEDAWRMAEARTAESLQRELSFAMTALSPLESYSRLAGEVEARNVQTRLGFSPSQRLALSPCSTADRGPDEVILEGVSRRERSCE